MEDESHGSSRGPVDKPGWPAWPRLSMSGAGACRGRRAWQGGRGSPADSCARTGRRARAAWSCWEGSREPGLAFSRRARCGRRNQRGRRTGQHVGGHVDVSQPRVDEVAYWLWRWHGAVCDKGAGVDPSGVGPLTARLLAAGFERGQELLRGSGAGREMKPRDRDVSRPGCLVVPTVLPPAGLEREGGHRRLGCRNVPPPVRSCGQPVTINSSVPKTP
jgi:hypothetical protein